MNRIFQRILTLAGIVMLPMGVAKADHEFSIVVLPDTQTYTALRPQILEAQIKWITDNRGPEEENIIYVAQLGDLKDVGKCVNGTLAWPGPDSSTSTEWEIVRRAFDKLNGVVPYGVSPGNHDFDRENGMFPTDSGDCPTFDDDDRPLVGYNTYFPPSSFSPEADSYGARMPLSNEDNYVTASSNGVDFLFINLGYQEEAPAEGSTDSIDWAETLLTNFPNHLAIVTSHYLVDCNKDPRENQISSRGPCGETAEDYNQLSTYGANIVDQLRGYRNLFMLIGGHRFGEAYLQVDRSATSSGAEGFPPVHAVLANYQHMRYEAGEFASVGVSRPSDGASGFFKVMEFDMDDMTIDMISVSPELDARAEVPSPGSGIFPVLSNGDRVELRSPRNVDVNVDVDNVIGRFDTGGASRLHDRSVSNLLNISFDDYVTVGTAGPEPFVQSGSRANDRFLRFLSGTIPATEVDERCADGDGCTVTLTRNYGGAITEFGPCNWSNDPAANTFPLLGAGCNVTGTGVNGNGGAVSILGSQSNTNCWFSDWDTSTSAGQPDQHGGFAVIIWNNTSTPLSCSFTIED